MDRRDLAASLASLISELLLLLLFLPCSNPLTIPDFGSNYNSYGRPLHLIHHFLSSSETAASFSLLSNSRKRKRTHHQDPDGADDDDGPGTELGPLARSESVIPQDPDSFKLCFRMSSSTFEWLAGLLEPLLDCRDPVGSSLNLPAETRLGIGLFRLSTGAGYPEISRRFRVSEPVTEFCVKQLCRVLCTNFRFWVGFPSPKELESVSAAFESVSEVPNCCGVIDCTRFKIVRDDGYDKSSKDTILEDSIAVQIVVDSSSRILSITAGFRGDKSNFLVLKSSTLYKDIEGGCLLDSPPICIDSVGVPQYLVGNGGYPLLPWLLVPFVDPVPGSCEEKFNKSHELMRLSANRTIGSLKNWGILGKPIEAEFKTAVAYIGACSILHNALLMREDYSAASDGLVNCMNDQSSQCFRDNSMEKNSVQRKAVLVRSVLATRAKGI